jgi:membrane protein DedA with SNARE-associated domain
VPFAFGISEVSVLRFLFLNIIGAGIWVGVVGVAAYFFGNALEQMLGDLRHYESILFILVAVTGAVVWIGYLYHRNRKQVTGNARGRAKEKGITRSHPR